MFSLSYYETMAVIMYLWSFISQKMHLLVRSILSWYICLSLFYLIAWKRTFLLFDLICRVIFLDPRRDGFRLEITRDVIQIRTPENFTFSHVPRYALVSMQPKNTLWIIFIQFLKLRDIKRTGTNWIMIYQSSTYDPIHFGAHHNQAFQNCSTAVTCNTKSKQCTI